MPKLIKGGPRHHVPDVLDVLIGPQAQHRVGKPDPGPAAPSFDLSCQGAIVDKFKV